MKKEEEKLLKVLKLNDIFEEDIIATRNARNKYLKDNKLKVGEIIEKYKIVISGTFNVPEIEKQK